MTIEQYQQTLVHLVRWQTRANKWKKSRQSLADKLAAYRLEKALTESRRLLRNHYYAFEDMCDEQTLKTQAPAANLDDWTCVECGYNNDRFRDTCYGCDSKAVQS